MFCKYCGSELTDDAVFCKNCGRKHSLTDGQGSTAVPPENNDTPPGETASLFHDHDAENMPVTPAKPSQFGKAESAMKRSSLVKRIRSIPRVVIVAVVVLCVIVVGLSVKKKIAIESYKKGAEWRRYEYLVDRFNEKVNIFNEHKCRVNSERLDDAGLDALEAYLDYYEGKIKIQGKGDYSLQDSRVEEWIILLEDNHSEIWGASDYGYRLASLKNRWNSLKR